VSELRESRARIVEAGDAARRQLERDLHDGAQQQLVALSLDLQLLRRHLDGEPTAVATVEAAAAKLNAALSELRELARGIHPAILTERGLEPAIAALCTRANVPADVRVDIEDRLPDRIEAATYFVTAEALTNIAKYAHAETATVHVSVLNGAVVVRVSDDGVGGADPAVGTGLRGLQDRVAAFDGTLDVSSPPGGGTTVTATIPLAGATTTRRNVG
jgi:signal transduction histidine kinase